MVSLVPHAETTAANLARVLRLHTLPSTPWEPRQRAVAARRLLEELGVRCDESAVLDLLPRPGPRGRAVFARRPARPAPRQPGAVPPLTQLPAAAVVARCHRPDRAGPQLPRLSRVRAWSSSRS